MKRQLLSEPNRSMSVCLNNRLEVMDIDAFRSPLTEREQELLGAFEGMWFAFPTPFRRGELVCQKHSLKAWRFPQNACYVLDSIAAWTNPGSTPSWSAKKPRSLAVGDTTDTQQPSTSSSTG